MVEIYKAYKKLLNNIHLYSSKNNISFNDWFKLENEIEKNIKFINYIPLMLISLKSIRYIFKFFNNNTEEIIIFYHKKAMQENISTKEQIEIFCELIYFAKNNINILISLLKNFLTNKMINNKLKRKTIIYLFNKYEFKKFINNKKNILKRKNLEKVIINLLIENYKIFLNSSKREIENYIYILLQLDIDYKSIKQVMKLLNINQKFSNFLLERLLLLKPDIKIFQFFFNYFDFSKMKFYNWHYLLILLNEHNLNKKMYEKYIKATNEIFKFLIKTKIFQSYLKEELEPFFSTALSYFNFEIANYLVKKHGKELLLFRIHNTYIFERLFNNLIYENFIENGLFLNNEYILNNLNNYILYIISNPNFKNLKHNHKQKITYYLFDKPILLIVLNEKLELFKNLKKYNFEFDLNVSINETTPLYLFLTNKIFYDRKKEKKIKILQEKHKNYLKFFLDNYHVDFKFMYNKKYQLESINDYLIDILLNRMIKLINNPNINYEEKTIIIKIIKKLYLEKNEE